MSESEILLVRSEDQLREAAKFCARTFYPESESEIIDPFEEFISQVRTYGVPALVCLEDWGRYTEPAFRPVPYTTISDRADDELKIERDNLRGEANKLDSSLKGRVRVIKDLSQCGRKEVCVDQLTHMYDQDQNINLIRVIIFP